MAGARRVDATAGTRARYYARSIATLAFGVRRPLATAWSLVARRRPTVVALANGLAFRCRDSMDLWIVKESCLDRDYEPAGDGVRPGDRVLDLGAGIGDFAVCAAVLGRAACVVACEPDPASFALLCENVHANGADAVTPLALAASADDGPIELVTATHAVRSATRRASGGGRPVASQSLDALLGRLPGGCDFLKIDIEGGEYDLFDACSAAALASVGRIAAEVHPAPSGRLNSLVARLEGAGFSVRVRASPVHRDQGWLFARRRLSA